MPAGIDPYSLAQQSRRMGYPSAYQGSPQMGAYAGGYGGYRMANTDGAVTGPTGSSSGANPQARAAGAQQMAQQQGVAQQSAFELGAARQQMGNQAAADQTKSIEDYRTARDNSQGAQDNREQRQMAQSEGIDPSSSATDIAAAASGPTTFDANGLPSSAGTGNNSVSTNEDDLRNAVVNRQAAKNGAQAATQMGAYAGGFSGASASPDAFSAGIAPRATPNMTLSAMPGMPPKPAMPPPAPPAAPPINQPPTTTSPAQPSPPVPIMTPFQAQLQQANTQGQQQVASAFPSQRPRKQPQSVASLP
jgi:hypothetical protein